MKLASAWPMLKQTGKEFGDDNVLRLAAALAFYTALSIAPLLLLVVTLAGVLFGEEAARGELAGQLRGAVGDENAETLQSLLANSHPIKGGGWAGLIGLATLIAGATGVFAALQDALNAVWGVTPAESAGGVWGMVRARLVSFGLVCAMAFLLLVSLVLTALLAAFRHLIEGWFPGAETAIGWANGLLSFVLTAALFAVIFKVLPLARVAWRDVWVGAALTAALFAVGKHLIGLYLGQAAPGSTFGAAGSFVVLLVWLYYSSVILLLGAEFTQVYATYEGSAQPAAAAADGLGVAGA